jgi:DNA invertase Pin-like site-specific DNA recombinase
VQPLLASQSLDTTTPAGRALFQTLGIFSEFEREMIRSRVKAGMARARRCGTESGKPIGQQPLPRRKVEQIRAELLKGTGILKTARLCGTGTSSVQRIRREMTAAPSDDGTLSTSM